MSRRRTHPLPGRHRSLVALLATLVATAFAFPAAVTAQGGSISASDIRAEWQLLTQRDASGDMVNIPAGVTATMLLFSGAVSGVGACSTYDSVYSNSDNLLYLSVDPNDAEQVQWRECDPVSRETDETFYANLAEVQSIGRADSVLVVDDAVGNPLMIFTRAKIANDPTASRWSLTRIGGADGSVERVIDGLDPWMEFLRGGSLVGNTGCGAFLGKYATNEGRIDITDVAYRFAPCTDGARAQAERFLGTLVEITDFKVRPAGLALEDENGTIRLALAPELGLDVSSQTWTPTAIFDGNGTQIYGTGNELTTSLVQFLGPKYKGFSICRPFEGNALRSGLAVALGQPTFVGEYCRGKKGDLQLGDIEAGFTTALEEAASYSLRGSELTLTDVDGVTRALLEPQPPLTGTTWVVSKLRRGKKLAEPSTDIPITATFEDIDTTAGGVVGGKTGVSNQVDENEYFGLYGSDAAGLLEVTQLNTTGKACAGKRAKQAACKDEALFLKLLQAADSYVARDDDLWLTKVGNTGRQTIMVLQPERLDASEE